MPFTRKMPQNLPNFQFLGVYTFTYRVKIAKTQKTGSKFVKTRVEEVILNENI